MAKKLLYSETRGIFSLESALLQLSITADVSPASDVIFNRRLHASEAEADLYHVLLDLLF
ncbi:hypothetical protein DY000_02008586 [Brassica cretica]|uniref:Uncharacterized protein n=1 Tax=Brassica cretica TaxID=69181 RepID=A0ABQ7CC11_BRACR|nr:hypothetical protein DY000_02008586 [Brassica cretica]